MSTLEAVARTDRMGVYVLLSHLLVTLAFIILYGVGLFIGKDVSTLEMILIAIVGYWFGAIGNNAITKKATKGEASNE